MIGRLCGKIISKHPPELLIDINGVGYEVQASMNTFYHLPEVGEQVTLHTHFVVREDAQLLYGFYELRERILFRTLIKVNGVGPKMAITILSSIDPDSFMHCIASEDVASLVRLPGVGKKTAERLVIEMRDKLKDLGSAVQSADMAVGSKDIVQDAISALVSLGYKGQEASRVISKISKEDVSSEELIRQALKSMVTS